MVTTFYPPEDIGVLSAAEVIRRRPGMFIGEVDDGSGMHHMLWEVIGNAIDECRYGGAPARVQIAFDGERVSVEDSGRGLPVAVLPDGRSSLEAIMTTLHSGRPWRAHHVHLGSDLRGVGVAVVCALSSDLLVEVWCSGRVYSQRFARGAALGPIEDLGAATGSGTRISFTPDLSVFTPRPWDIALVVRRGRDLAALIPGVEVIVDEDAYCCPNGIVDHIRYLAGDTPLIDPFHVRAHRDGIDVELAIAWVDRDDAVLRSFVNVCDVRDGKHVEGMFAGLRTVLAPRVKSLRRVGPRKLRARLSRGMIAIVHASLADPRYGNPTKDWLENEEVGAAVRDVVETELPAHFERVPALLDWLIPRLEA